LRLEEVRLEAYKVFRVQGSRFKVPDPAGWRVTELCGIMRYYAVLCGIMRYFAVLCGTMYRIIFAASVFIS
jgi:hypothetical protein